MKLGLYEHQHVPIPIIIIIIIIVKYWINNSMSNLRTTARNWIEWMNRKKEKRKGLKWNETCHVRVLELPWRRIRDKWEPYCVFNFSVTFFHFSLVQFHLLRFTTNKPRTRDFMLPISLFQFSYSIFLHILIPFHFKFLYTTGTKIIVR